MIITPLCLDRSSKLCAKALCYISFLLFQAYGGGMRPPLNALGGPGMPGMNMYALLVTLTHICLITNTIFYHSFRIVNEYSTSHPTIGVPEEDRGQIHQIPTLWVISTIILCEMSATTAVGKCLHLKSICFVDILSVFLSDRIHVAFKIPYSSASPGSYVVRAVTLYIYTPPTAMNAHVQLLEMHQIAK